MSIPPTPRAVRARREFDALSRSRRRGRAGALWVVHADHVDADEVGAAVAFAIGRAVGSAVVRNRIRRRLRALMSDHAKAGHLQGLYLIGATAEAADASHAALAVALDDALARLS